MQFICQKAMTLLFETDQLNSLSTYISIKYDRLRTNSRRNIVNAVKLSEFDEGNESEGSR